MHELTLFVGRDKGLAVIIAASNLANSRTMVDASTRLYEFGSIRVTETYRVMAQDRLDPEVILGMCEERYSENAGRSL